MGSKKEQELGVRSPLKLRAGIDFPNWKGVNRQNDPGAIEDTQFQDLVNARINGNDIVNRGGQAKTYATGVDGCIYSMIDVQGDLGVFIWDQYGNSGIEGTAYIGLNRFGLASYDVTSAIGSTSQLDMSFNPRRNVIPFAGKLYIFGTDPVTLEVGLFNVSFPDGDDSGTTLEPAKWSLVLPIADFNSFVVRVEITDSGTNQAMYIGTKATNTVYRWDGATFTTEATGVGAGALVMGTYHGEIYAAGTNTFTARGINATWSTTYAMPGGVTSFEPSTMVEYVNQGLICGKDTAVGFRAKVLSFDGTTLTLSFNPGTTFADFTDLAVGANGLVYFGWHQDTNTARLTTYNGSAWTSAFGTVVDSQAHPGALLALGSDLYWWTSNDCQANPIGSVTQQTGVVLIQFPGYDIPSATIVAIGDVNSGLGNDCPADMNVLM